jgi:hypothetical protein
MPKFASKFYYEKKRFLIISKYRYMHRVLNIDEIIKLIIQFVLYFARQTF